MSDSITFAREHQANYLAELVDFLRIPSISTQPERAAETAAAAQ